MERRGLVAREECRDDGRGAFVVLTTAGRAAIESAAPPHVDTVRRLVFDDLTPEQLSALAAVTEQVLGKLDAEEW
jgi:DNA-binding MarR family transcriptional regulator